MSNEIPPSDLSNAQVAVFIGFTAAFALCAYARTVRWLRGPQKVAQDDASDLEKGPSSTSPKVGDPLAATPKADRTNLMYACLTCPLTRVLSLDHDALVLYSDTLDACAEFGAWMLWFFLADRTTILSFTGKQYSRDIFLFTFATLVVVAFVTSIRKEKRVMTLSRHQTEEWKGWMQVLFLLYHYFEAREAYNLVRVLIAGYVWMTGYGNFHYYYRTGDYCIGRFAQMMWRLNFLVTFCCIVLRNDYMLYYICPMHTIYTVLVYAALGIGSGLNQYRLGILVKMLGSLAVVVIMWDIKAVFYTVWAPFKWLVGYQDPRKPSGDELHEWFFRSGLDRYVWIWGMLMAWAHPQVEAFWKAVDNMRTLSQALIRSLILIVVSVAAYYWYTQIFLLDKLAYNNIHPYTSWIPITLWVIVRNITTTLRSTSLAFFGWLGCITLETYISQFHVWLSSNIPNGQPKWLLTLVPGYPMVNFLVTSLIYVFISYRLFTLTNALKQAFVPHSDNFVLGRNVTLGLAISVLLYFTGSVLNFSLN